LQQVRHRKNTRRNIFNIVNDDMRGSAYAPREEVRVARFRAQQNEEGRLPEEQKLRHVEAKASMHKRDPTSNLAARS
jgi:hypothetical protein